MRFTALKLILRTTCRDEISQIKRMREVKIKEKHWD